MNLPYSPEQIEELKEELYSKAKELVSRELPSDCFALFCDAYHTEMKDESRRIRKAVIYTVLGIDMQMKKDLYGYYVFIGSENKGDWLKIFNNLISRGLRRVMIIVSDDFPGLSEAVKTLFPQTDHQLCLVHMQRNIYKNMSKADARQFSEEINRIKHIGDYEDTVREFEDVLKRFEKKYPAYIKMLNSKKENYFCYKKYPEEIRKHIYTTNAVENINSRLEVLRVNSGGYFQSEKTASVAIYVIVDKIRKGRWSKPMAVSRGVLYELQQMFQMRFAHETQNS
ncbi:IS256 family transposase [Thermodesulfovibrio hydrogeniphilus]